MKQLLNTDFLKGGIFYQVSLSDQLPIPKIITDYLYGDQCICDLDISSKLNLLIYIWKLKGIKMFKCACQNNHLVSEEFFDQIHKIKKLEKKDFQPNGLFHDLHIPPTLPLPSDLINYIFKDFITFETIPEGSCFKSNNYQIKLLKLFWQFQNGIPANISKCKSHLIFY